MRLFHRVCTCTPNHPISILFLWFSPEGWSIKRQYDAANRLRAIRRDDANQTLVQDFTYGSTNARLIDFSPYAVGPYGTSLNTFYASVGGQVLAEYIEYSPSNPTWTKSYTYLGDTQLATILPNGQGGEYVEFNHPDRLGTRLVTNPQAGTDYEQAHLPCGTVFRIFDDE